MVHSKETAEEQLLRIIEASSGEKSSPVPGQPVSGLMRWMEGFRQFPLWLGKRLFPERRGRWKEDPFLWNLRLANRLLWVVLLGLAAYVGMELFWVPAESELPGISSAPIETPVGVSTPARAKSPVKPLTDYLTALAGNPFRTQEAVVDSTGAPAPQTVRERLVELTSGLVVVGLDRGARPVAFIESSEEGKTYVVGIGEQFKGVTVKAISAGGVTLSYEGEEIVLP